uniref:Major facilitator superfamily (MFS) profile domain-containing protein n=1 Tax=Rhodosorus marinus TaxID=101924 RepID=A0A6T6L6W0_9RHOD|mmetsp:Transcript_16932/g.24321  ORF Transcript_16932/g.24321 Transcript_16932/m.24321 type:complete len:435 (+) Transcript_16932:87-1391(+)
MTGVINILFGFQTSLMFMIPLWALNGVFQGFGAPPCAKLLTTWYAKSERGTWWGFWNTSHNTGGFFIPLVAGYCVRAFGWQYGMIVPGSIAIGMSMFLYNRIRDTPGDVGLPPVDVFKDEATADSKPAVMKGSKEKGSAWKTLKTHVISNPYIWLLAISYFFVYFVRQGVSSWAHIFLLDYKMVGNAQEAAFRVSGMEIGGLLGSLTSGWASDRMMRGRRIPVIILWLLGVMTSLVGFYYVPGSWRYVSWLSVFCIGFFIYGPQMLVGLAGAEIVDKSAVSSAIGLLGWIAYLGASVAGFPLTKIVTNFGWGAYVASLLCFSAIAVVLLLPMWRLGMPETKVKPVPVAVPAVVPEGVPAGKPVPAVAGVGEFRDCEKCAATGFIIKMDCGPATPNQAMSCKFIEVPCINCGGTGHVPVEMPLAEERVKRNTRSS